MLTKESLERRMAALTKLAIRTREKVEKETYVVYVEDTAHFPTQVVEIACQRLGTMQSWFPKSHELIEDCRAVAKHQAEQSEAKARRLQLPEPANPERLQKFLDDVKAEVRRKAML